MLGPIIAVTMTVADLAPIEDAYSKYLGYRVIERGQVPADLAAVWGAASAAGQPYLIMQPESGANCYLRFVAIEPYADYQAFHTYGWNSTEILVTDVDAVHERLKGSPFEVIGEPRALSSNDDIKAMQVMGPEKEILYFTRIKDESYGLGVAKTFVDRPFIVINGGRDMAELIRFYRDVLGIKVDEPIPVRLSALNRLRGLDLELRHPLSTVDVGGPFKIEIDQYPPGTVDRPVREGDLPPGTAIVAFEVDKLDGFPVPFVSGPIVAQGRPYNGRRVAVIRGPSGEMHELIETGP